MRASGVGNHPAHTAAFPPTKASVSASADSRVTSLSTPLGCSTDRALSNQSLGRLAAAARATARCGGRLRGPDEATDKGALDLFGERVDVESFPRKKRPRI